MFRNRLEAPAVAQLSIPTSSALCDAELWMGVHPNGPSVLADTGESLAAHLAANPHLLGDQVNTTFSGQLPFLFKVLRSASLLK